jgi:hypothetical protein
MMKIQSLTTEMRNVPDKKDDMLIMFFCVSITLGCY